MFKNIKKYFTLTNVLFSILFIIIAIIYGQSFLNGDTDVLWHIKQGDWLVANKKMVINKEIFTYHFDYNEWFYLSWLSDVILSFVYKIAAFRGIIVFTAFIISIHLYMIVKHNLKNNNELLKTIMILIIMLPILQIGWLPRPYIFSYFFIVVWFILIDNYCNNRRKLILILPILQIIWVNMQSSFIYGYIIGGLFFIGELFDYIYYGDKKHLKNLYGLLIIGILTFLTSLINPFGIKCYQLILKDNDYMYNAIMEYSSINFHSYFLFNYYILFLIVMIVFFLKKNIKTSYIVILLFWLFSGLEYIRHLPIFGIVAVIILPNILDFGRLRLNIKYNWFNKMTEKVRNIIINIENHEKKGSCFPVVFICVFLITIIFSASDIPKKIGWDPKPIQSRFGIAGTEYIKTNKLDGKIYNNYLYGGYMIWECYPDRVVFIDPRASIYPEEIFIAHIYINSFGEGAFDMLDKFDIKYLFISKTSNLASAVQVVGKNYKEIYSDQQSIIFEKTESWREYEKDKLK